MTNLKITTLQTNLVWGNIEANLIQLGNKLNQFIHTSDIIILPDEPSLGNTTSHSNSFTPCCNVT